MDEMAREINAALDHDLSKLRLPPNPVPPFGGRLPGDTTVSEDIRALKAKLDQIMRGLEMLKGQL